MQQPLKVSSVSAEGDKGGEDSPGSGRGSTENNSGGAAVPVEQINANLTEAAEASTENERTDKETIDDSDRQDCDDKMDTAIEEDKKESQSVNSDIEESVSDVKTTSISGNLADKVVDTDSNDNHMKTNVAEESNDEEPDIGNTKELDGKERNKLFQSGLQFDQNGKKKSALKCYLGCIDGLKADTAFTLLPQCLRNIADIYYEQEDYPHAVHFIQAEKLFYENALVDTAELHSRLEKMKPDGDTDTSPEAVSVSEESLRAEEYEGLARLCVDKEQKHLALEYAGKAAKIWQKLYGDNHPTTQKSLDFFTSVYAEVGKQQYSESMRRFSSPSNGELATSHGESEECIERGDTSTGGDKSPQEPVSILRRRKTAPDVVTEREKRVRFDDSQLQHQESKEQEEQIATQFLWVLFIICILVLLVLGFYVTCRLNSTSDMCLRFKSDLHYLYMRLKYWYYQTYGNSANKKYV